MNKIHCSVGILTFNSDGNLGRLLESLKNFSEIIICDGGSTDNTLKIAKKYNCKIIEQDKKFKDKTNQLVDFSGARNQCIDESSFDWFFYIDSDDSISEELVKEISSVVNLENPEFLVYNLAPKIIIDEKIIEYSSSYPGWRKMLFNKKTGARFRKKAHERIFYDEDKYKQGYLKSNWYFYVKKDNIFNKFNRCVYVERLNYLEKSKLELMKNIFHSLTTALKVFVKTFKNYLFYGFSKNTPIKIEIARIYYQLRLAYVMAVVIFLKK